MIKKEIIIALTAIIALALMFVGLQFLKGKTFFSNDISYTIKFADISGLTTSSPIFANGFKVGTVRNIKYDYDNPGDIRVEVDIDKALRIPEGTGAEITSDLLGNVQVSLLMGDQKAKKLESGGVIQGVINDGTMGEVKKMIPTVQKMLPKLDSIMASLNVLLADPAIANSLHNVQQITYDLTVSTRELNALLAEVNGNMPEMMVKASKALTSADNAMTTANTMMTTINNKVGTIDVAATMYKVDQTLANMQQLTDKLNSNQGSLGLLMNDRGLYDDITSAAQSIDSLFTNLKAHPKRYVHFSVFGKKEGK